MWFSCTQLVDLGFRWGDQFRACPKQPGVDCTQDKRPQASQETRSFMKTILTWPELQGAEQSSER
jgi:hypothetical protein